MDWPHDRPFSPFFHKRAKTPISEIIILDVKGHTTYLTILSMWSSVVNSLLVTMYSKTFKHIFLLIYLFSSCFKGTIIILPNR